MPRTGRSICQRKLRIPVGVYSDSGQFYPSVDVTIDYHVRYFPEADIAFSMNYSTASE